MKRQPLFGSRVLALALASSLAVAAAELGASPARSADDKELTLSGCLVRGDGDGDPYLLTNAPAEPALGNSPSSAVNPTVLGTGVEINTIFYWLEGHDDLKAHVGHRVEIVGELKGDLKDGEIKADRKDRWTELTVKADGRSMKARVPNTSVIARPGDKDRKARISVRRIDVERVRMIAAACEP